MKTTTFPAHAGHAAPRPAATTVRAAPTKDYLTCADIWLAASLAGHDFVPAAFWRGQRAAMAENYLPSSQVLLLTADGEPAAFAATLPDGNCTYLAGLFVLPRWWGRGLGRQLLKLVQEQVLAELPDQKNASLRCTVYEKNSRALAFYARMGFITAGRSICPHTNEPQTDMLWTAAHTVHDKAAATCRPQAKHAAGATMSNHSSSSASSSAISLPKVALIATGGTIAGVAPTPLEQISYQAGVLTVDSMLETLPGIEGVARITSVQCGNLPSENITPEHWAMLGEQCAKALDDPEICGVVLTHGTDTLEESAFYLHLTLASPKPVVLTGSMRPATSLSADGPINIRDAVAVAACPQAQARGALLVMNSRVLSARTAVKVATLDVEAFRALESGCLGRVINGEPQFYYGGEENPALAGTFAELAGRKNLPRVDVIYGCAGMPVDLVRYSVERSAGIVLAGMGNGSMPDAVRHELRQAIAGGIPVIRCSRTGSGPVTPLDEYEGFVPGGMLSPAKARVLLMLALEQQKEAEPAARMLSVREVFALGAKL